MLRGNFDTVSDSLIILMPYALISIGCALFVFLAGGVDRTPWRYSSVADHLQVIILSVLAIVLALVLTFALNRLEPVARSLPIVQGGLIISILVFARSTARFWYGRQIHINGHRSANGQADETLHVLGVSPITVLFLLSWNELACQRIQVAGIVADEPSMRGRVIQQQPVLGTIVELPEVLQSLEVHGVMVDKIVVATAADRLGPRALETILEIEKSS